MIYLVSYQHSGNTWLRYCIEFLSKRPTHGHQAFSISERNNNFLNIDIKSEPIAIKRHELIEGEINNNDTFILLLRNPSECIKIDQNVEIEFARYYGLIESYDKFIGEKLVFYYEDMFSINEKLVSFLDNFSPIDSTRMVDFTNNFTKHLDNSLSVYKNKRKKLGASMELINKSLLEHELIRKYV